MNRQISVAVSAALAAVLLAGCGGSEGSSGSGDAVEGQTFTVAFDADSPPFSFVERGEPAGFEVDVMDEVAERAGFTLKKTALPFDGILPSLQAGQADIGAAAITIRPDRAKVVSFSIPYFQTGIALATTPDNSEVRTAEDLAGRSVAVRTGSSNSIYIEELPYAGDIEIHRYNNTNDQLQAVLSGVDDAAVNDGAILDYYIATAGEGTLEVRPPLLTVDNYGYAVAKDQPKLKEAIDAALIAMAEDGTYAEIYSKYFGNEPENMPGEIE